MSVANDLIAALSPTGLPCVQTLYCGSEPAYITFNFTSRPLSYADDDPWYERYVIQVHLYTPIKTNTTNIEAQIKFLLHNEGYAWPDVIDVSDNAKGTDGSMRHIVFETETVVGIDG